MISISNMDSVFNNYYLVDGELQFLSSTQKDTDNIKRCHIDLESMHGQPMTNLLNNYGGLYNLCLANAIKRMRKYYAEKDLHTSPQDLVDIASEAFTSLIESLSNHQAIELREGTFKTIDDDIKLILYRFVSRMYNNYQYKRFTQFETSIDLYKIADKIEQQRTEEEDRIALVQELQERIMDLYDYLTTSQQEAVIDIIDTTTKGQKLDSNQRNKLVRIKERVKKALLAE